MQLKSSTFIKKILGIGIIVPILLSLSLYARETVRIMPLGDSITHGANTHSTSPVNPSSIAYRGPLWTKLSEGNYTVDFVGSQTAGDDYLSTDSTFDMNHEGYDGVHADWIANNVNTFLTDDITGEVLADVVLLHIGTNDLVAGEDPLVTVSDVTDILDNIDSVDTEIEVVIARIINRQTFDQNTSDYNDALEAMVLDRMLNGDDIVIVDMENDAGIDYSTDMNDTLHPNDATGYPKMAELWYSALKTVIPTHMWTLDQAAAPYIDDYRDANGTCASIGCPSQIVGMIDNAKDFNGTQGIDITDTATFDWAANDSFTIAFWMKSDTPPPSGENDVMIGRKGQLSSGSLDIWYVGVAYTTGKITYGLGNKAGSLQYGEGSSVITGGDWKHIAYVVTSDNIKVYVNGVKDVDVPRDNPNTEHIQGTPVTFGYLNYGDKFKYKGSLDEVVVFDGALSEAQINRYYDEAGLSITTTPVTSAQLNTPYSYDANSSQDPLAVFDWTGGISPANWMSINEDGEIAGTPDSVANIDINITATKDAETATQDYVLKVRNSANLPADMGYYWKLDEAGSPYLDSYQGADGICAAVGCPTPIAGQIDTAQNFNGTQGIDVKDTAGLNLPVGASLTIEFWMKTDTSIVNSKNNVMIGRADPSKLSWFIAANKDNGGKVLFALFDSNDATPAAAQVNGDVNVTDNSWHHIACVRDGDSNKTRIYVDGNLSAEETVTYDAGFEQGSLPLTIGYLNWNSFEYEGLLDEVALFNVALSKSDIQEHYNNGLSGKGFENGSYTVSIAKTTDGAEPTTNASFTVTVTPANDTGAAITGDIIYSGTATNDSDYATGSATFSIADGSSTAVITLATTDDTDVEGTENITATISNLSEGTVVTGSATADLADDDVAAPAYEVSIAKTTDGAEPTTNASFTVTVTPANDTGAAITGDIIYSGTATNDSDYATGSATFSIADGSSTAVITLATTDDTDVEGTENITATISNLSTGTIGIGAATADLADDDVAAPAYEVSIAKTTDGAEPTTNASFTVTVTPANDTGAAITGDIIYSGTATNDSDYATGSATFSIADGSSTAVITLATTDDTDVEGTENITATISNLSTGTIGIGAATADLVDDDVADTTAPVIALTGTATVDVVQGATYTDEGATATDDVDGDITSSIITVNPVDTATVATYTVTYNVSDAAGNPATQVTRTVNVLNWYTESPDGNTYTSIVGNSSVTVNAASFTITQNNDEIIFEENGPEPKVYIKLMSNGEVVTGYTEGGVFKPTASSKFAAGTKVSIDVMTGNLVIETPIKSNITLGGL